MAASPQVVTQNPLYLNARTNTYTADELRKPFGELPIGPGVVDLDSFRVRQRVAGANMSVDCVAASVLNRAYVRSTISVTAATAPDDAGLYRVDYNSASILNLDIAAADATNPRIDQVFLAVEDQQASGTNNQATVRVVTGTPTGGATLDNRTGVGAVPAGMGSILLADVLVPAASASVVTANIRDRRPVGHSGTVPWLGSTGTQVDQVSFVPFPGASLTTGPTNQGQLSNAQDSMQAAVLMFLPRRIVGATKIRWRYGQYVTAMTSNYVLFIADASGRVIAQTGVTAWTGLGTSCQEPVLALTATTTFEAGWYYVCIGCGVGAPAASGVYYVGVTTGMRNDFTSQPVQLSSQVRNLCLQSASGGTTVPTTILAYTDSVTISTPTIRPAVPVVALSVT